MKTKFTTHQENKARALSPRDAARQGKAKALGERPSPRQLAEHNKQQAAPQASSGVAAEKSAAEEPDRGEAVTVELDQEQSEPVMSTADKVRALQGEVVAELPVGRERSLALTKLDEAFFWLSAAESKA